LKAVQIAERPDRAYFCAMLRLLSRFIGYWCVAAALVAAVVDGAKSIAASTLVTTPLSESWAMVVSLDKSAGAAPGSMALPWPLDAVLAWLANVPTVAALAVLGFLFLAAGRKRRPAQFSREFAA
jgi:hypothetical protein